jgi:hypothetical protein
MSQPHPLLAAVVRDIRQGYRPDRHEPLAQFVRAEKRRPTNA